MTMSETAKHHTLDADQSMDLVRLLDALDLRALSFVQLKRLQTALRNASEGITRESARRSEDGASGDTVRVPSPNL